MFDMYVFYAAPLSSEMLVEIHDESYARIHLGNIGVNMDFFVARICFKGGSTYNINILQVLLYFLKSLNLILNNVIILQGQRIFMPDVLLFLHVFLQANEMRNIEQLAKSYDRDVAAIANSLTSGINRFIDVIAGNYSMKGTIGQLVEATDSLSDKVHIS